MMRRALTDYGHAVSHLSTLVPKLAATAAAAGDPYPLLVLEASKRHPESSRSKRRTWSTTPAPRPSCAAAVERSSDRASSIEPDAEQPNVTGVQPYHDNASAGGDAVAVGRLISVNLGRPRDIQWEGRTVRTAVGSGR